MKRITLKQSIYTLLASATLLLSSLSCERDVNDLDPATYPTRGDVFIDDFASDLNYSAFAGSDTKGFEVVNDVTYNNSKQAMRFAVPDYDDPAGSYVGGAFYTSMARDLSGYNALTFYIKASQAANIAVIGFGNDLDKSKYIVNITEVPVNTNWRKVIIPIPDPSKLTEEKGMLYVSEGPEDDRGYTFWIDEVKFEYIGTIEGPTAAIMSGSDISVNSYVGVSQSISGITTSFNLPNGVNQAVNASPYYFDFTSSDTSVASVSTAGVVTTVGGGTSVITATLGDVTATGSLTVNSSGEFTAAPTPTVDADDVISIFSDAYTNVTVDYYNGYWEPYQTTLSADFAVNGDNILNYTNFNFVGIQMSSPTVDASGMSTMHMDMFVPDAIESGATFTIQVVDYGDDGVYGNDDSSHTTTVTSSLVSQNWISFDLDFDDMTGLTSRSHIGQIIFVGSNLSNFYADNIYFYNDGSIIPSVPTTAAPTPTASASSVLSIFSDAYTNVSGTDFNPNWGQSTAVSQPSIAGDTTLLYSGLNYQGTAFASSLDVSSYGYIHIDYYTANSTSLNFYLISHGPMEKAYSLSVPSGVGSTNNGWQSVDIPLSAFSSVVDLTDVFQFKVDGNGNIYFDNIYFHN